MTNQSHNPSESSVTVLGLGAMGQALAGAFLKAGHPTTIWNRTPNKGDDLVARGAVRTATAAEAVRASDLVIVCLYDYEASQAVLGPIAADLSGRVLVNLTSDTPERSREAAAWAAEHGVAYLDGAILVPVTVIGTPDALLFHSGPKSVYERHEGTLKALGGKTVYLGEDHGLAAVYDNALLDFFWTSMAGLVHAFALAGADGVKGADLAPYLSALLSIFPPAIESTAVEVDSGEYPGEQAPLATEAVNVDHIIHASAHRGLDVQALNGVKAVLDRAIAKGHGADGWTAVIEAIRTPEPQAQAR
ncbi:NAD(P)-binding domain-containing protein [Streptomyces durmitorensis]|uniref:NAD(P)-binding domain-containing protein n=1 Tax=Streptomyces durmitorensis TaxID=319947 RepID=A0ABY4PTC3_9ACTN|nr:NAD(P)-binding domain-containing protein [Streptomyces durmitorensis]UQT56193.1 NAD(P)-binding domain-containing protein [Streptomyces durmitorensis]